MAKYKLEIYDKEDNFITINLECGEQCAHEWIDLVKTNTDAKVKILQEDFDD